MRWTDAPPTPGLPPHTRTRTRSHHPMHPCSVHTATKLDAGPSHSVPATQCHRTQLWLTTRAVTHPHGAGAGARHECAPVQVLPAPSGEGCTRHTGATLLHPHQPSDTPPRHEQRPPAPPGECRSTNTPGTPCTMDTPHESWVRSLVRGRRLPQPTTTRTTPAQAQTHQAPRLNRLPPPLTQNMGSCCC